MSTAEPFMKLGNQGMILGEIEFQAVQTLDGTWIDPPFKTARDLQAEGTVLYDGVKYRVVRLREKDVEKRGDVYFVKAA